MSTKTITVARNVLATLLALAAACLSPPAPAAVFTTNLALSETNFAYDGQDIVIDGVTVAITGKSPVDDRPQASERYCSAGRDSR